MGEQTAPTLTARGQLQRRSLPLMRTTAMGEPTAPALTA